MPPVPAMPRRVRGTTANRVRARSGRRPPASSARPVLSRHRIHRLARSFSCGWGMPEKSRTRRPSKPRRCICQASRRILGVPSGALGQVGDLAGGTRPAGRPRCCAACRARPAIPARCGPAARTLRWRPGTGPCSSPRTGGAFAVALVAAALQRVLHLQLQLRGQAVQPDPLIAGTGIAAAQPAANSAAGGRARARFQVDAVRNGTSSLPARPTARSCRSGSCRRDGRRGGAGEAGQPVVQVRRPGPFPRAACRTHRSLRLADAVAHPGARAAGQRRVLPRHPGIGRRGETRTSGLPAAVHRCRCPWHSPCPPPCGRSRAPGTVSRRIPGPAGRRRAHRPGTPGGPRPSSLPSRPGCPVSPAACPAALTRSLSSAPSKTVAVTLTATPPRQAAGVQVNGRPAAGSGVSVTSSSPSACRHCPNRPAPARGGGEDLAGQAPAGRGDGPRDHRQAGCASRMAASSAAACRCQRARSAWVIQPPVTTTLPSR